MFRKLNFFVIGNKLNNIVIRNMSIEESIRKKLHKNLNTTYLDVINESPGHSVPKGAETHFRVVVVSEIFNGLSLLKRHRMVNDLLKHELENGVHALSIVTHSPEQWSENAKETEKSPPCRGGYGK